MIDKSTEAVELNGKIFFYLGCIMFLIIASPVIGQDTSTTEIPVRVETQALVEGTCSGQFVAHDLDYSTTVPGDGKVRMFDANGGGVALNDLDNDGRVDIVFANQSGQN